MTDDAEVKDRVIHSGPNISSDFLYEIFLKKKQILSTSKGRTGRVVFQHNKHRPGSKYLILELDSKRRFSVVFDKGDPVRMIERGGKYIIEDI